MSVVRRFGTPEYATPADLVAETIPAQNNDVVRVASLSNSYDRASIFRFIAGDTTPADGSFIIDQTSETANGRWVRDSGTMYIETEMANASIPPLQDGEEYTGHVSIFPDATWIGQISTIVSSADVVAEASKFGDGVTYICNNNTGADMPGQALTIIVSVFYPQTVGQSSVLVAALPDGSEYADFVDLGLTSGKNYIISSELSVPGLVAAVTRNGSGVNLRVPNNTGSLIPGFTITIYYQEL